MNQIRTQIQLRNDSKENWASTNPKLGKGEIGIELDTNLFKIGDGIQQWNDLKYANDVPEIDFSGVTNSYTEAETLEGLADGKVVGDVGIVKTLIGGDKYSYSCYIWNGTAWKAADGNYNAENVYFDEDLITTVAIGNVGLVGGQAELKTTGKNLKDLWQMLYVKEDTTFTATKPTVTVSGADKVKYIEIGKSMTADISVSFEDGSYPYGYTTEAGEEQNDASTTVNNGTTGSVATKYNLTAGGVAVEPNTEGGNTFSVDSGVKTAKASMSVVGSADYSDGYVPVSNLKKMYPSKKITAGTTTGVSKELYRWYVPMWYGFRYSANVVADPSKVTADVITSLTKVKDSTAYSNTVPTTSATATGAWRQFFVAVPVSYGKNKPSAKDGNNVDCSVYQAGNISVDFSGTTVAYNVFYIDNAADYGNTTVNLTW